MYNFDFHRPSTLRQANGLVGKVEGFVVVLAGAQQLPGTDPQLAQQVAQLRGVGRGFQVQHDGRAQASALQQFQRAA